MNLISELVEVVVFNLDYFFLLDVDFLHRFLEFVFNHN